MISFDNAPFNISASFNQPSKAPTVKIPMSIIRCARVFVELWSIPSACLGLLRNVASSDLQHLEFICFTSMDFTTGCWELDKVSVEDVLKTSE
jgi:hypothetical protein